MTDVESTEATTAEPRVPHRALFLELENVAVAGHQIVFKVIKSELAPKGVKLTPTSFTRFFLDGSLLKGMRGLLELEGKTRLSAEKLRDAVTDAVHETFTEGTIHAAPGLKDLVKTAQDQGAHVGALTCLPDEVAGRLAERLGLSNAGVTLSAGSVPDGKCLDADAWRAAAAAAKVLARGCLAVGASVRATRGAMAAGMRAAAIINPFNECQDFGGVDLASEALDGAFVKAAAPFMMP